LKPGLLFETEARGKRLGLFIAKNERLGFWPVFELDSGIGIAG